MAQVTAEQLIRQAEGYRSTPYWDVNAWRIGYGSDTMTDANGNVTRVTRNSTTTRDAAQRDLERRIPQFQSNGIIRYVGQEAWDRLPSATQAAITSVAYNYGGLGDLRSLRTAIQAGDTEAMATALEGYANHNGGVNRSRRLSEAAIVRGAPIPPGGLGDDPLRLRERIQDREAGRLGYGEIAPNPGTGRPAYFNETGAPPIPLSRPGSEPRPATMSPALQAARQRLTAAREMRSNAAANGETSQAAMSVTPRITTTDGEVTSIQDTRPPLDWGQFRPGASVGGVGSLLDGGINPATPNPSPPPVAGLRLPTSPTTITGRPDAPIGSLPVARTGTTITGRPDAPIGSLPAAQQQSGDGRDRVPAPPSPASGPSAGRPGGATEVPMNGSRIDNGSRPTASQPQAVPRAQETARLSNGTEVTVGQSYRVGNRLMIAEPTANGGAVLRDVNAVRDQFLRDHVDQNAPLLFENSLVGTAARSYAAPIIRGQIEQAGNAARDAAGNLINGAVSTVGNLANQARDTLGNLFAPRAATPAPVSENANLNSARNEQATLRMPSSSSSSSSSTTARPPNTLSAPGAGLTQAQRTAMATVPLSASVQPLTAPSTPRTTTTTITNPAYTQWQQRYGDGSQVQTAATGGNVTRNQLAAIQNVNGAVQAPIVHAPPPPPPRTITVTRPAAAQPAAAAPPAPRPSPIVTIGGFLYDSSQRTPTGAMLRLGRVGSTGNTLTAAPRTSSAPLTGTARVAASLGLNPGSVAATEAWHNGGGVSATGGGPAVGGSYGGS